MRRFAALALVIIGSAQVAHGQAVRRAERAQEPGSRAALPADQRPAGATLRTGDSFEMSLSGMPAEENFARAYTIGNDGFVNIPYAGQVRAAGLTQSQLERAIEQRFVEGKIYRWPTVTINVQSGARYVTIGGSVRAPQRMVWAADLTLSGAVMAAGGAGDFGGDKVNLIRSGNRSTYSLKKIRANPADDPRLFPGDQVELR